MTTLHNNFDYKNIAIPQTRYEAMLLAAEALRQIQFIEECIDSAITYCEASTYKLPMAA